MKAWLTVVALLALLLAGFGFGQAPDPRNAKPAVVELLEDDAESFIANLTQIDAPSEASRDERDKFAGTCSVRVSPLQRYNPTVKNWDYPIVEKPGPGQYRYIRFAWKKVGGTGIMVQFHAGNRGWENRYVAGTQTVPWPARKVAEKMPAEWEVVTRDLFKDFGAMNLTGIALTPMDGTAGLYDHIFLGRTIEDLDKVTSAVQGKLQVKQALTAEQLKQHWGELTSDDPTVSAPAAATLVARPAESLPFLAEKLRTPAPTEKEARRIAELIDALDANDEAVRERSTAELAGMGKFVVQSLREARVLRPTLSLEAHRRIERILLPYEAEDGARSPEFRQSLQALRVLERVGTAEARDLLAKVADGTPEAGLHREAKAAVDRLTRRMNDKP